MFYDYLAVALIALGVGDLFLGLISDSETATDDTEDATTDPTTDTGDMLTPETGDPATPDTGDSNPDAETGDPDPDYISSDTQVTVETNGNSEISTFEDIDYGIAPTVSGTQDDDIITASPDTGLPINLQGGAGDDTISFGFGASVFGGAGADVLELAVTHNALASNNAAGAIDLTDPDDTLAINFAEDTPEFVHIVRGQSTQTVDGAEITTDWLDYYVSDQEDLSEADLSDAGTYTGEATTHVFRAVIGEGTADAPATVNEDATITLNRDIASFVTVAY